MLAGLSDIKMRFNVHDLTDKHAAIPDCDCHSCALAERTRLQYEATLLMASMSDLLRHFTKTPSNGADSDARGAGHKAIARMRKVLNGKYPTA